MTAAIEDEAASVRQTLRDIGNCRRCDCLSCKDGYENHSHACTGGPHCVETAARWQAWRQRATIKAERGAQMISRLLLHIAARRDRIEALERELAALKSPVESPARESRNGAKA